jgi:biotin carboxylase
MGLLGFWWDLTSLVPPYMTLIEEFIEGREISVESITWNGVHHILAMTDKVTTGAPYFVETEQHQPSTLPENVKKQVGDIVQRALTCLGVRVGASHSELLITADHRPAAEPIPRGQPRYVSVYCLI